MKIVYVDIMMLIVYKVLIKDVKIVKVIIMLIFSENVNHYLTIVILQIFKLEIVYNVFKVFKLFPEIVPKLSKYKIVKYKIQIIKINV